MSEFAPFRFNVVLFHESEDQVLCRGQFSEVSGLELTMEQKTIREGGRNFSEHQRSGHVKFPPVVLKRGVTEINDLYAWFDATTLGGNYGYRLNGRIEVFGNPSRGDDGALVPNKVLTWKLSQVLPTRFKGPDLSATATQVAIEELQLVHEGIELERGTAAAGGGANA